MNGVGEAIVKYPEIMRPLFVHNNREVLTAGVVLIIMVISNIIIAETMKAMFHFSRVGATSKEHCLFLVGGGERVGIFCQI